MTDLATSAIPSTSAPSSAGGVTLEAIMAQLQHMNARLDTLIDELCQVNTCISRIARRQARFGGFTTSLSPSPEVSADEDGDDDEDEDANSSNDDEMTIS